MRFNHLHAALASIICSSLFLACNNGANRTATTNDSTASVVKKDTTKDEGAYNFIDACVEMNKGKWGEAKAFAHCKCMQEEIKSKYGNTDSTTVENLQKDTVAMAKVLNDCK